MPKWNYNTAIEVLRVRKDEDFEQIFTGAYMMTGAGDSSVKHENVCRTLSMIHHLRDELAEMARRTKSMQLMTEQLADFPQLGGFIAYEIVCDLRHTKLMDDAHDILSWAHAGPGAKRGIHRIWYGSKDKPAKKMDYVLAMRQLRAAVLASGQLDKAIVRGEWPFELREIEHSLCEFDKYERVRRGEGRPRSLYRPPIERDE
jgi:hypothetical protein